MSFPLSLRAYRAATTLAAPFAGALLSLRLNKGKEDAMRLGERRGLSATPRPEGALVWLHGASVGETLSLLPLVERLTQAGLRALVTSGTVTSAELMARRLPPGAIHQYAPLDTPVFTRRFFAHWRPDIGLIAESELWPNMIVEASRAGVPMVMVNARMSPRSFARWTYAPAFIRALLERVDMSLAQSLPDAERLLGLGARAAPVMGNLKYDAPAPPVDRQELAQLSGLTSGRQIWIAASTHEGEEEIAAEAHKLLAAEFPDALTLIAPRHAHRGEAIRARLEAMGLKVALRSRGERPLRETGIYICDTMGELGLFYRLAGVVLIGKSLTSAGGQNPIEPAKLGSAILHGPRVGNFADVFALLDQGGGAVMIQNADEIAAQLRGLFGDAARLRAMARAAAVVVEKQAGAVDRALGLLGPRLEGLRR